MATTVLQHKANTSESPQDISLPLLPSLPQSNRSWLKSSVLSREGVHIDQVLETPKIFISSAHSAWHKELLEQQKIKAILSIVPQFFENLSYPSPQAEDQEKYRILSTSCPAFQELGIARYLICFNDNGECSESVIEAAFETLRFLCKVYPDQGILVHCSTGTSRSVALVAALIAKYNNCSFEEAAKIISEFRDININESLAIKVTSTLGIQLDS